MIQWLQSKLVLMVAGIILISSVTAVFHYQLESMEREELEDRCRKITRVIDKMDKTNVDEMRQRITFEETSEGIYLSPQVRGGPYNIEIRTDFVRLEKDDESVIEGLTANVHFWNPEDMNNTGELDEDEKRWRDSLSPSLKTRSGDYDIDLLKLELRDGDFIESHIFIFEVETF